MTRALITGITGQDGSFLAEHLLALGYTVYGLARRSSQPRREVPGVTLLTGDVTDFQTVRQAIEVSDPHEIYNLAAQSFVGASFDAPGHTFDVNARGAINVFEAALLARRDARVYQASTSEMFGVARAPLNESSPLRPRSPYGVSKIAAHVAAQYYRDRGLAVSCGILFNHESERRGEEFLSRKVTRYVGRLVAGGVTEPLFLGDLSPMRDWGYAGDYVAAMRAMLQADPDDFVIATGVSRSVEYFVARAFAVAGLDWKKHVVTGCDTRPTEVPYLCGDASKARRKLGWWPAVGLDALIERMVLADIRLAGGR
jgi:GDPmannose 4,6-dehydratase